MKYSAVERVDFGWLYWTSLSFRENCIHRCCVGRNHKDWKPNIPSFFSSFQSSILLCYFPWATIIDSTIFQSVDQIWCFYSNCASFNTSNIGYLWTHSYNIVINFNQITIVQLDKCNERCKYILLRIVDSLEIKPQFSYMLSSLQSSWM